jgi:hypothetical protein
MIPVDDRIGGRSVSVRNPSYRLHKPSGKAVVTIDGRDFYLGKHGSAESRAEYDRLLAEWLANGRRFGTAAWRDGLSGGSITGPGNLTINEMVLGFIRFAEGYYRKDGKPTGEVTNNWYALLSLRPLYMHTLARDFGPLALKAMRQEIITSGLCRNEVNRRTRIIVRAFKWAVEAEMRLKEPRLVLRRPRGRVLVAGDAMTSRPVLDGKAIPVLDSSQYARGPESWLKNEHRAGSGFGFGSWPLLSRAFRKIRSAVSPDDSPDSGERREISSFPRSSVGARE